MTLKQKIIKNLIEAGKNDEGWLSLHNIPSEEYKTALLKAYEEAYREFKKSGEGKEKADTIRELYRTLRPYKTDDKIFKEELQKKQIFIEGFAKRNPEFQEVTEEINKNLNDAITSIGRVSKELPKGITPGSNPRSEVVEEIHGATGVDSSDTWSKEDIAKLF